MATHTIFKSNSISLKTKDNDYRYVTAKNHIKKGELLLMEHCYTNTTLDSMTNAILMNNKLFNNLYPRKEQWTVKLLSKEGQTEDIKSLLTEKAQKNVFGSQSNDYSVCLEISNFNHSTTPNAFVKRQKYVIDENTTLFIMCLSSINEINIGEEIFISYGKDYFGDNSCICDYSYTTNVDVLVTRIMQQYLQSESCRYIIINHVSASHGLYFDDDSLYPTNRFLTTFKNDITSENIYGWIKEKNDYYEKLLSSLQNSKSFN